LSQEEEQRNTMGTDVLFVGQQNQLYDDLGETFYAMKDGVEVLFQRSLLIVVTPT